MQAGRSCRPRCATPTSPTLSEAASVLVLPTFASPVELHTQRCVLRQWRDDDFAPWAEMNADPEVRRYFPSVLDAEQAAAEAGRCRDAIAQRGFNPAPKTPAASAPPTGASPAWGGPARACGHSKFPASSGLPVYRVERPALRRTVRAGGRDRLAPAPRGLGPRLCHRSCTGGARIRVQASGVARGDCHRRTEQRSVAACDAATEYGARRNRRLRSSPR